MHEKIEKIKRHVKDNKNAYIASGATAAGMTIIFLAANQARPAIKNGQQIHQIAWRPENTQVIINLVEKSTPSKPVHLVGTDRYFDSLSHAAREMGYAVSDISKVVNGKRKDIKGDVFEFLQTV